MGTNNGAAPDSKAGLRPPPDGGWFRMNNEAIQLIPKVGPMAFCVYVALLRFAGSKRSCYPSVVRLAAEVGTTGRTVYTAIKALEKVGAITVSRGLDDQGHRRRNVYQLLNLPPNRDSEADFTIPPTSIVKQTSQGSEACFTVIVKQASDEEELMKKIQLRRKSSPAGAGALSLKLTELIGGWNALGPTIVKVGNGARRNPPSKVVLRGWERAQRDPELAVALSDVPALLGAIRKARFCHRQDWFSLPWILGRSRDGELHVTKLLNGAYDHGNRKEKHHIGAGQRHDPTGSDPQAGKWE